MAHTKAKLDEGSITDLIDDVVVENTSFKDKETGEEISYQRLKLVLPNGDYAYVKCPKELKVAVYYATLNA